MAVTVLAAAVALMLFGIPLAAGVASYYANDERIELERLADSAALAISSAAARHAPPRQLADTNDVTTVGVYGPDGVRVQGSGPGRLEQAAQVGHTGDVAFADNPDQIVVAVAVGDQGHVVSVVRAATPRSEVRDRTWWTWLGMLLLAAGSLTVTWLLARWQARKLAAPVEQLAVHATRLGSGDFAVQGARVGVPEVDSVFVALEATARRLGDVLARERAFSADASHQLRTPLTGLRLQLEAGLDNPDADLRLAVAGGIDTADRLERTIDDLLSLARDERASGAHVPLGPELARIAGEWRDLLARRDRELRSTVAPELLDAPVAGPVLRQVVAVLLDNAATHGTGTVFVRARDLGEAIAVDIEDQGLGLATDLDVFDRHRSLGNGYGIGLALARRLAEAEGGRLMLTGRAPTVFTLLLPVHT